jgi:GNAT superfamily N-acetyltransferase
MDTFLTDLALARRLEKAWAWTAEESARVHETTRRGFEIAVEFIGGGVATYFGPGSPLSQAVALGLEGGPVTEADLDRLEAFYDSRGVATAIEVATLADPGFLPTLSRRGYFVAEQTHMSILPLVPIPRILMEQDPPGVTVGRVGDSDRAGWSATVIQGFFEGPGEPPDGLVELMTATIAGEGASGWLARVDENRESLPAGGGGLFIHDGLALFAGDATIPTFRGRGAQSALVRARLREASTHNCDLAVVCTHPGTTSQRNYERHGFRLVYARTLMVREPKGA